MDANIKIAVVIVAGGAGQRFGERKQFKELKSRPLYYYSLIKFLNNKNISDIVVVVPKDMVEKTVEYASSLDTKIKIVEGGKLRQNSVLSGVKATNEDCQIICIHDAARPFIDDDIINRTIAACIKYDGAIAAIPASDTVKEVKNNQIIKRTIDRERIWLAQTPQVFFKDKLLAAFKHADANQIEVTDEASLFEVLSYKIKVVPGSQNNFKITTQADWEQAKRVLQND